MSDKNSEFKKSEKIIAINMKISVFFFALTSWEFSDIFVFPKQKNLEYFKNFLTFLDIAKKYWVVLLCSLSFQVRNI